MNKLKIIFFVVGAVLIAIVFISAFSVKKVEAIGITTYGGKVNRVTYCTCYYDPAVVLEIDDYATRKTVKVKYSPMISKLREYYNIWTAGVYVIGGHTPGNGSCMNTSGYYCTNSGTTADGIIDNIIGIGTSQSAGGGGI